ncbi:hypothetical protein [Streptomyces sp. NPDC059533]|uniref:hypothetical protein n=1 Tax=unclassified Streptomyces TaxID=2593676 RepID=UPI0036A8BC71
MAVSAGLGAVDTAADIVNAATGAHVVDVPEEQPGARSEARRARRGMAAALASDSVGAALDTLLEGGLGPLGVRAVFLWRRMAHVKVPALARERAAVVWDTVDTGPVPAPGSHRSRPPGSAG